MSTTHRGNYKLTEAQVRAIREAKESVRKLAVKYGVSQTQVHRIKTGENWQWVKSESR